LICLPIDAFLFALLIQKLSDHDLPYWKAAIFAAANIPVMFATAVATGLLAGILNLALNLPPWLITIPCVATLPLGTATALWLAFDLPVRKSLVVSAAYYAIVLPPLALLVLLSNQ